MVEFLFLLDVASLSSPRLSSRAATRAKKEKTRARSCYEAVQFPIKKHPEVANGSRVSRLGREGPSLNVQALFLRLGGRGAEATGGKGAAEWGGECRFLRFRGLGSLSSAFANPESNTSLSFPETEEGV